jgi:hypothetical protein
MTNYRRGVYYERRSMAYLRACGYTCFRAAASKGPADIVAIRPGDALLVEVRSGHARRRATRAAELARFLGAPWRAVLHYWPRGARKPIETIISMLMLILAGAATAQWRQDIGGVDGAAVSGRVTGIAVDAEGTLYALSTYGLDAQQRGSLAVWRVSGRTTTLVTRIVSEMPGIGCSGWLSMHAGRRRLLARCGTMTLLRDLDGIDPDVRITGLNQPQALLDRIVLDYASIYSIADTGAAARIAGDGMHTCDTSATRLPLASSIAVYDGGYLLADTVCYGRGALWSYGPAGAERLTGWGGEPPMIGASIRGRALQSPVVDSRAGRVVLLSASDLYVLDQQLIVRDIVRGYPGGSQVRRLAMSATRAWVLDVLGQAAWSAAIAPEPTPTATARHTATATLRATATWTYTATPAVSPTPTAALARCPADACEYIRRTYVTCGCDGLP